MNLSGKTIVSSVIAAGVALLFLALIFGFFVVMQAVSKSMPWIRILIFIVVLLNFFIFCPLGLFKKTRVFSNVSIICSGYIFFMYLWILSVLFVWEIWGGIVVFVGILVGGFGIIPIAFLATVMSGEWGYLGSLIFALVLSWAALGGGRSATAERLEDK